MKYRKILLNQLQSLPYFDKKAICQLSEPYNIQQGTVDAYIKQSLAHRDLFQLKKGLYVTAAALKEYNNDISYILYLANILRQPSYVTSWSALQYYDLTTEAIYTITSVTPKVTRAYNNKVGSFMYHSIKKEFFFGFLLIPGTFDFFIASPAKALFDLIYFKTNQFKGVRFEDLQILLDDLRIDIDEMDKKERENFYTIMKRYCKSND
ncbi:MAG: hypothetical protein KAT71_05385 [Gammaproteobacteria bacterium]|nr:hypothetical protein [Gammaproteobacteria bacterium]